jgi:hypothetical protein
MLVKVATKNTKSVVSALKKQSRRKRPFTPCSSTAATHLLEICDAAQDVCNAGLWITKRLPRGPKRYFLIGPQTDGFRQKIGEVGKDQMVCFSVLDAWEALVCSPASNA